MPVIIENLTSLGPEDRTDIEKIRNDAPQWLPTDQSIDEWLSQPSQKLFAGRFNDRLIVAALITEIVTEEEKVWNLTWLCVRKVTRDRCVGQRIVSELKRIAKEAGCSLSITIPNGAEVDQLPSYLRS
ncbi:PanM family protein [Sansalvadorimonas sp. 2012CJ34-2]|uniref:PanM family protein n=1 Tax=Parendozoicomonas callyspongiae TaxID=2942213 RepID=A0ABT0PE46_9GAMM|nr:acetyl-CoA sensor PanZ family protein [Sansalvadorimonas sp. 2012CJ34-2]MCL6269639.1 PanM family protein [Sansalvadorimonas sp. 2012CJ34-2]